ncbi:unnamed protein product [Rhizophagus irregularis]|nr:unnamed protein product [Rhizophagus irregularis]
MSCPSIFSYSVYSGEWEKIFLLLKNGIVITTIIFCADMIAASARLDQTRDLKCELIKKIELVVANAAIKDLYESV